MLMNPSTEGDLCIPGKEPVIAPGIRGIWFDKPDGIYIAFVHSTIPGKGNLTRMLNNLPKDRKIVFTTVVSALLATILTRRGYVERWFENDGDSWSGMVLDPTLSKTRYYVINGRPTPTEHMDASEEHGEIVVSKLFWCPAAINTYGCAQILPDRKKP